MALSSTRRQKWLVELPAGYASPRRSRIDITGSDATPWTTETSTTKTTGA